MTRTRSGPLAEMRRSLASKRAVISPFVSQLIAFIQRFSRKHGYICGTAEDIETALREALANAIIHGNREDTRKRVYVTCVLASDGELSITVRDEGQGFDAGVIPDPTDPNNLLLSHGRGIYLIRALMDEVSYEDGGKAVHMRKKLPVQRANRI
jgi:anti-sigma regulatory factor (Ser/Thr protein kinase)